MKQKPFNYEREQYHEQERTNWWLIVNTAFTIIAGIATTAIAYLSYIKK